MIVKVFQVEVGVEAEIPEGWTLRETIDCNGVYAFLLLEKQDEEPET